MIDVYSESPQKAALDMDSLRYSANNSQCLSLANWEPEDAPQVPKGYNWTLARHLLQVNNLPLVYPQCYLKVPCVLRAVQQSGITEILAKAVFKLLWWMSKLEVLSQYPLHSLTSAGCWHNKNTGNLVCTISFGNWDHVFYSPFLFQVQTARMIHREKITKALESDAEAEFLIIWPCNLSLCAQASIAAEVLTWKENISRTEK